VKDEMSKASNGRRRETDRSVKKLVGNLEKNIFFENLASVGVFQHVS
jgi:hypothetical protein